EPLARLVGEDGELAAPVERPREIELVAVEPGEERGPRQTCADVRLDEIGDGDSGRHLLAGAIWERDLDLLSHQTRRPGAPGLPSSERLVRPAGIEPATPTVSSRKRTITTLQTPIRPLAASGTARKDVRILEVQGLP